VIAVALRIHWGSGSPYAWRVLLALEHKRMPYESRVLSFAEREHKTPEFLAISPRGKVPAIEDGGFALTESMAILAYLEAKQPDPPLLGRTPEQTGRIWRVISEYTSYLDDAVESFILPLYAGAARAADKAERVRRAAGTIRAELARYEASLDGAAWLAGGDEVTAADYVVFPAFASIQRAAGKDAAAPFELGFLPVERTYPRLAAWQRRIEALPGYERTYPPHWR
jgi:glutathione S-transferase